MGKTSKMAPIIADRDFRNLANYRHKMVSVEMKEVQQTFTPATHSPRHRQSHAQPRR